MPALPSNKYQLKTLHQEIDLFDRKIAHLLNFTPFLTPLDRKTAAGKMIAKRALLVKNAKLMAAEGIPFEDSDLPRSFREPVDGEVAVAAVQD